MHIRKISIGGDYKTGAMHYMVGQSVLSDTHTIHAILANDDGSYVIWIQDAENAILLWKKFNNNMPITVEYNINF